MKWRVSIIGAVVLAAAVAVFAGAKERVKEPAVAGAFYPADANELSGMVDGFLSAAENKPVPGKLMALISPHAGYVFSGGVAAHSYRHITEREINTVIIIGASHYAHFNGASVYAEGSMKTPLGAVKINKKAAKTLINEKAGVSFNPNAFEREHSLEVQLPFLQRTLKKFTIVPVLIGAPTRESFDLLSERLTEILRKDDKAIIVASTDLSHYHDYGTAVEKDRKVIDAVGRMSVEDLEGLLSSGEGEMCGGWPVLLTMMVARNLGATNGILYKYANSGDVSEDKSRVVGYAAMGLYRSPLTNNQKGELLSLAKQTIVQYVKDKKIPNDNAADPRLMANGATFVTINRNGRLRGCIGNIQPVMPLYKSVIRNAVAACSRDHRFTPMTPEELKDMEVEVTILSPLEILADVKDIRIGTHGLFLMNGSSSGILLPQVPTEFGWDAPTFLEQVSIKAGLPKDAWKTSKLYTFTADIVK